MNHDAAHGPGLPVDELVPHVQNTLHALAVEFVDDGAGGGAL